MRIREYWIGQIEQAWRRRSVVWLSGVRRAGKTVLCQSLSPPVEYFDCELPRVRQQMEDPEAFLESLRGKRVALDEVHRLGNPTELLKIAADHFPETKVIATGSSTLQASTRFRDTLTGRKAELWLTPMVNADLADFGNPDLRRRLQQGGLPPFFLEDPSEREYQEWMDSYWAKDIQELFRLERRWSFQRLVELLLVNSGGIFEATTYATPCEISRATVANYLGVLEATRVAHVVRPFATHRPTEIVSAPKVYGLDTGFVCYYRGWRDLRPLDLGALWEHYVLNELQAQTQGHPPVRYWRDKRGHEVDFVLTMRGRTPLAIECKWSAGTVELRHLRAFRHHYPEGENWVVARDVDRPFRRTEGELTMEFVGLEEMARRLGGGSTES